MAEFKLKRGYNLKIAGKADKTLSELELPKKVAVQPNEFRGVKPKLSVAVGDKVNIGTALFEDKLIPELKFVSPVSGEVKEINRGARRALLEIVVENDHKDTKETVGSWSAEDLKNLKRDQIIEALLKGGMWPHLIQRPFSRIAIPGSTPRDIFISAMDTSPLAADPNFIIEGLEKEFQAGIDILKKLTDGTVYLSLQNKNENSPVYENASGVEINKFSGPHPAGNVGVQIHHIKAIKRGDIVWYIKPYAVALIGKFFGQGFFQRDRVVATAGSSLTKRQYFKTIVGTPVAALIPENIVADDEVRYISGNVLSGRKISSAGYVSYYDNLITAIPEGKKQRSFLEYLVPGFKTPSFSKTFLSNFIAPTKTDYVLDTRMKGGHRAFVATGDYERVLPMDIYPVYLMKSILADDIEEMEGLGILELDEEDIALCTYICLSKTDFGGILRSGLNLIEKEG
jgi:Na+-transporting NADH:ubiquinone oxidoreductase subunit A